MIDLDELRAVLEGARDYYVMVGAWTSYIAYRNPLGSGAPQIIRDLDDRHPEDRVFTWAFEHLHEVLDELEQLQQLREVVSA